MHAVIVDDVELARRSLAGDLAALCPDVVIVGEASGVATGTALLRQLRPDIVFLDVTLDDGTGFDLLAAVGNEVMLVVLTTASAEHGIRAVKAGAIDYLLKPIDPDDLTAAVAKARARLDAGARSAAPRAPAGTPAGMPAEAAHEEGVILHGATKRLALNTADRVHVVALEEILRCESHRNYTLFHLDGRRQILVTRTLKEFDELLESHGFFRAHHSHLINIAFVREYVKGEGGFAVMSDGTRVPIAVRKKEALLRLLGMERGGGGRMLNAE